MQLWFLEWVAQLWPGASWGRPCFQTLSRPPTVPRSWTRSLRSLPVLKFFFDLVWLKFNVRRRSRGSKIGIVKIKGFFPQKIAFVSPSYTVCFLTQPCFDLCRLIFAMRDICRYQNFEWKIYPILTKLTFQTYYGKLNLSKFHEYFESNYHIFLKIKVSLASPSTFSLFSCLTALTAVQKTRLSFRIGSLRIQGKSLFNLWRHCHRTINKIRICYLVLMTFFDYQYCGKFCFYLRVLSHLSCSAPCPEIFRGLQRSAGFKLSKKANKAPGTNLPALSGI